MRTKGILLCVILGSGLASLAQESPPLQPTGRFAGTQNCRPCHEKFYQLWAPSHHGLAMQPFSPAFAKEAITPWEGEGLLIKGFSYRVEITDGVGQVVEQGPDGEKRYPMAHALGGKNVYYFLTPLARGKLQTLPLAYDVRKKAWFDTAASGLRHVADEPLDWRDTAYTFNTACYSCHVSQLSTNYDLENDQYCTTWAEPGINCETCHGPGEEHVRFCENLPEGEQPADWKIARTGSSFTVAQNNATCAPCHAKMNPITASFQPGDRFFDHYDLTCLEDPDFYPDGRDLGENYTQTGWLMNPCVKAGALSCLHCHTSSGRYKHAGNPNQSCLPCHKERVENVRAHSHHPLDCKGSLCISCHMPMTEFARMRRSDHSLLAPAPAATLAFDSPNACNLCHTDQDAAWADAQVREWHAYDYQAPVLHRAGLIEAARQQDWTRLPEMLAYLAKEDHDAVFTTSLIRLLRACEDPILEPALRQALGDPSALVRGAAAESLGTRLSRKTSEALIVAAGDDYRLVRIRAAAALAGHLRTLDRAEWKELEIDNLKTATMEFLESHFSRPDQWTSHYNLGNFFMDNGDLGQALAAFETALRLEPRALLTLVNAALAYARAGDSDRAEDYLQKALGLEPECAAAHFNLGLLRAEQNQLREAEHHLRTALGREPEMVEAAYNLGILIGKENPREAVELLERAFASRPSAQYGYTLAFFVQQTGDLDRAVEQLNQILSQWPDFFDAYLMLGDIYQSQDRLIEAEALLLHAQGMPGLSQEQRSQLEYLLIEIKAKNRER